MQMKRMRHDGTAPTGRRAMFPIDQRADGCVVLTKGAEKQPLPVGVRCFRIIYIMSRLL